MPIRQHRYSEIRKSTCSRRYTGRIRYEYGLVDPGALLFAPFHPTNRGVLGIDRSALSELLVPLHLGIFVYAAAHGDFVLGGLQAVFETELDALLRTVAREDYRCPLDPGCMRVGGACMACLHWGNHRVGTSTAI